MLSNYSSRSHLIRTLSLFTNTEIKTISETKPSSKPVTLSTVFKFFTIATCEATIINEFKSGSWTSIENLMEELKEKVLTLSDEKGNTLLHLVVMYQSAAIIEKVICKLSENASKLSRKVNLEGKIPLQLLHLRYASDPSQAKLIKLLLPITLDYTFKPLSELLIPQENVNYYPETKSNPRLKSNLEIACIAINRCRKKIDFSSSHPSFNHEPLEAKTIIYESVNRVQSILGTFSIEDLSAIIEKQRAGNCYELAVVTAKNIVDMRMDREIKLELMSIQNGDHIFVILDREEDSKLNDFTTWGKNAVYVDAWSGHAIPIGSERFLKEFKAYMYVSYNGLEYNFPILLEFNPKYHTLGTILSINYNMSTKPLITIERILPPLIADFQKAHQFCIWGQPTKLKAILEKNHDPFLLTGSAIGDDHRGPGFIPAGTLLERALFVGDYFIREEKSTDTMIDMLKHYVITRCGEEEFKKQIKRAHEVIEIEDKKKAVIEKDDLKELMNLLTTLYYVEADNLEKNKELQKALDVFKKQLQKPGNEKIMYKTAELYNGYYAVFGFYNSPKNNFIINQIYGLTQLTRLSVSDLQMAFTGIENILEDKENKVVIMRSDVRRELDVLNEGGRVRLGFNCHLRKNSPTIAQKGWLPGSFVSGNKLITPEEHMTWEKLYQTKAAHYEKLSSSWQEPLSLRSTKKP